MRQRVISSLVGLVILVVVMCFIGTPVLNVVMALICVMAMYEILNATGCLKFRGLAALSFAMALVLPFARSQLVIHAIPQLICLFFVMFFILLIKRSTEIRVEQAAMTFMFSVFVPLFFSCAVFLRDRYGAACGGLYLLIALGTAWLSDTGAYFVGRKWGRHKLAPVVSPKKTVEGAIGGVVVCAIFMQLLALGYIALMQYLGTTIVVNHFYLALATPVCSVMGIVGDLSASVIKRQFNVKDFGDIMPGHGGVMDRFDSVMFTLPSVFILSLHVPVVTV